MTPMAQEVIAAAVAGQSSPSSRKLLGAAAHLLSRCSEIGIGEAFEEYRRELPTVDEKTKRLAHLLQRLMTARDDSERYAIIKANPELLDADTEAFLDRSDDERVQKLLNPIKALIEQCRVEGIDKVLHPKQDNAIEVLGDIVKEFLFAETEIEKRRLVESNPALLSSAADTFLEAFSAELDDEAYRWCLSERRLLRECRQHGIEYAFSRFSAHESPHFQMTP
jgi:hypothetical protein